jgi:hypothetical protein
MARAANIIPVDRRIRMAARRKKLASIFILRNFHPLTFTPLTGNFSFP